MGHAHLLGILACNVACNVAGKVVSGTLASAFDSGQPRLAAWQTIVGCPVGISGPFDRWSRPVLLRSVGQRTDPPSGG